MCPHCFPQYLQQSLKSANICSGRLKQTTISDPFFAGTLIKGLNVIRNFGHTLFIYHGISVKTQRRHPLFSQASALTGQRFSLFFSRAIPCLYKTLNERRLDVDSVRCAYKSGPLSTCQRNAIRMAFRWEVDSGPRLIACAMCLLNKLDF